MNESNDNVGSWAIETENVNNNNRNGNSRSRSSPLKTESRSRESLDNRDLRHRLRKSRGKDEDDSSHRRDYRHENDRPSPVKSPSRQRSYRSSQDKDGSRPNYRREKDGLSPLRSPLTSEPRSSRRNTGSRRRSVNDDNRTKKENDIPMSTSPSKKNKCSVTKDPPTYMNPDSEDGTTPVVSKFLYQDRNCGSGQRFRRRLDLPSEKEPDNEEGGYLDPHCEEDRITMERREKTIAYGKITESYKLYIKTLPKSERGLNRTRHPRTPIKELKCSRRSWDAQIKAWKKYVHQWANENFPNMPALSKPAAKKSVSNSSTQENDEEIKEEEMEEEEADEEEAEEDDDSLDLNEEEDESFLEGFEIDYTLEQKIGASGSL